MLLCSVLSGGTQWRTLASRAAAVASQDHTSSGHGGREVSAAVHEACTGHTAPAGHSGRDGHPAAEPNIAAALQRRLAALAAPQPVQPPTAPSRLGRQHMPQAWQSYLAARGYPPQLLQTGSAPDSSLEHEPASEPGSGGSEGLPGSAKLQKLMALLEAPVALPSDWQDASTPGQSSSPAGEASGQAPAENGGAGSPLQEAAGHELAAASAGSPAQEEAASRHAWLQDQEDDAEGDGDLTTGESMRWGGASRAAEAQPDDVAGGPTSWEDGGDSGIAAAVPDEAVPRTEQLLLQAGIVGVPNSGKSTLTNALVGQKVCSSAAGGLCLRIACQKHAKRILRQHGLQTIGDMHGPDISAIPGRQTGWQLKRWRSA